MSLSPLLYHWGLKRSIQLMDQMLLHKPWRILVWLCFFCLVHLRLSNSACIPICVSRKHNLFGFVYLIKELKRGVGWSGTSDREQEKQWKAGLGQRIINWPTKTNSTISDLTLTLWLVTYKVFHQQVMKWLHITNSPHCETHTFTFTYDTVHSLFFTVLNSLLNGFYKACSFILFHFILF